MGSAVDKAACQWGMGYTWDARTWYLVRRVLHTPVSNIIPTRKGITALEAILDGRLGAVAPVRGVMLRDK